MALIRGESEVPVWRRATRCGAISCVEVAMREDHVLVRDGKHPSEGIQRYSLDEWAAFLDGVRHGEFDPPPSRRSS